MSPDHSVVYWQEQVCKCNHSKPGKDASLKQKDVCDNKPGCQPFIAILVVSTRGVLSMTDLYYHHILIHWVIPASYMYTPSQNEAQRVYVQNKNTFGGIVYIDDTFGVCRLKYPMAVAGVHDMYKRFVPLGTMISSRSDSTCMGHFLIQVHKHALQIVITRGGESLTYVIYITVALHLGRTF